MKHTTSVIPAALLHLACALASILLTHSLYILAKNSTGYYTPKTDLLAVKNQMDSRSFSFEGDDIPFRMPLAETHRMVAMEVEESVHYSINAPEALDEWSRGTPYGGGTYRIGTLNRTAVCSLFHQLHCIRILHGLLVKGGDTSFHHAQHCLRYLREEILCDANTSLEPGDFTLSNFSEKRVGATYGCRDWNQVYKEVEHNWALWRT